jgi:hypothetical protein
VFTFVHPALVGALVVGLTACGSSTAPKSGGPTTTATYVGAASGAAATGTFVATFTTTAALVPTRAPSATNAAAARVEMGEASSEETHATAPPPPTHRLHDEGNGSGASVTITLLNGQTLTLTGSTTDTSFTVSDNAGDSCTGTIANALNAQCTLAAAPGATFSLVGLLQVEASTGALATYCGLEHIPGVTAPDASILLGIAGSDAFVARISVANNYQSFYLGTATGSAFTAAAITTGYTNGFGGTYTASSATGVDSAGSGNVIGDWAATAPCTLSAATVTPSTLAFTADSGAAAPAAQSVLVSPATLGPMTAVVPSSATWLTASTDYDTLKLSVAAPAATGTETAVVSLYPQFASNAPLSINVTYTVSSGGTGPSTAGLWLGNSDGQMFEYTNLTTSNAAPAISAGTGGATGAGYLAVDPNGNLWISSAFRQTVVEVPKANFATTTPTTSVTLIRPPDGNAVQPTGIAFDKSGTLWVADSANSGWFYGFTTADLAEGTPTASHTYNLIGVATTTLSLTDTKFAGLAYDASGNLWIADQGASLVFEMLAGQLTGSNVQLLAYGYMAVGANGGSRPNSLAFDSHGNLWVSFLGDQTGGAVYEYSASQLSGIQGNAAPVPYAEVSINGVADSISSLAFDQAGDLWLVESAAANATTGLAMVPVSALKSSGGNYAVTPTVTYSENRSGPQLPTSIAFDPAPTNLPIAAGHAARPLLTTAAAGRRTRSSPR